jgi:tetratricopeptide (TPR) repeat protein
VSHRCLRPLAALTTVVCLGISVAAQTSENAGTFKGELRADERLLFGEYRVELISLDQRANSYKTDVQLDGSFFFRDVRSGTYSLNVMTTMGDQLHSELVTVVQQSAPLTVRLPMRTRNAGTPGTVSMKQLLHPPDRKAFQAVLSAQRFSEAGRPEKAAEELEKAIRISPQYADAYNNLAVQHMRLGRYEDACRELLRSTEITGPQPQVLANLAFAQRHLGHYQEALESAQAALKLDRSSAAAHLVVGSILAAFPKTWAEGVKHLEIAAETIQSARATLEQARHLNGAAQ